MATLAIHKHHTMLLEKVLIQHLLDIVMNLTLIEREYI